MKKIYWFLLIVVVAVGWSCSTGSAEYTPSITTSYFYLNPTFNGDTIVAAQDTLGITGSSDGTYVIDTIQLGDTVAFYAGFCSYGNELIAARVTHDTTQLNMYPMLTPSIQAILLPTSNVRLIQLEFVPNWWYVQFPIFYTPLKSGVYEFTMKVESDSQFSPRSVLYRQPVR